MSRRTPRDLQAELARWLEDAQAQSVNEYIDDPTISGLGYMTNPVFNKLPKSFVCAVCDRAFSVDDLITVGKYRALYHMNCLVQTRDEDDDD